MPDCSDECCSTHQIGERALGSRALQSGKQFILTAATIKNKILKTKDHVKAISDATQLKYHQRILFLF
jgi:hypothetical protein